MAGRYWYLEKKKTSIMIHACIEFENSMGNDINNIARALKYKGDIEILIGLELDTALLYKVKEKLVEEPDVPTELKDKLIIFGCLSITFLITILIFVGAATVLSWIFFN
ncbi:hypothetical protein SAMN06295926_102470 [Lysinibacillus sp. AC-3]|nr:hypothetical protein SAMN06295926_102470 [Lysinibacillus sp. AC-3]